MFSIICALVLSRRLHHCTISTSCLISPGPQSISQKQDMGRAPYTVTMHCLRFTLHALDLPKHQIQAVNFYFYTY